MTPNEEKILKKLQEDKEKLIAIKKKYGKEYEELPKSSLKKKQK